MDIYERAHRALADCGLMATAYRPTEPNGTGPARALTNLATHPEIDPDHDADVDPAYDTRERPPAPDPMRKPGHDGGALDPSADFAEARRLTERWRAKRRQTSIDFDTPKI